MRCLPALTALAISLLPGTLLGQNRLVVLEDPLGTAVAVSIILGTRGLPDAARDSASGTSNRAVCIAGRAVIEEVRPQLEALGARASSACHPPILRWSLLARPATWRVAADIFLATLFQHGVGNPAIRRARESTLAGLQVVCGNPGYRLRTQLKRAFHGAAAAAVPGCGAIQSMPAIAADDLRHLMRALFLPGRAAAAVAGPVNTTAARDLLARFLGNIETPVPLPLPAPRPTPDRHLVAANTITAQVGIMLPLPDSPDTEALRLLEYMIERRLEPGPARRDVYSSGVELRRRGRSGTFAIYLVTETGRAEYWADRVPAILEEIATGPAQSSASFRALLARYRGERLGGLASPEARALDAARQAFFGERYRSPRARIESLTLGRLRSAAQSLGKAVIVVGMRPT